MNKLQMAEQLRRALQMFAQSLSDEDAMEVATVFPKYEVGKNYKKGVIFTYGENSVGDPQLYRVEQPHTSQADWIPSDKDNRALYTPIGLNDSGYPIWSKPTGAHDAYNTGDIVDYNGTLKRSKINGNTYSPDEYPDAWEDVVE